MHFDNLIHPHKDCKKCTRLRATILTHRREFPEWHNAPVNSFGAINSQVLIVGLAPGLKGANRTGRPFTGDFSGKLLFSIIEKFGFTKNQNGSNQIIMKNCRITNAVRCFPPKIKPLSSEIKNCAPFLHNELKMMKHLKVVLALGVLAHQSILTALNKQKSKFKFAHNNSHKFERFVLIDSYHCSRYNVNTGRLTIPMFCDVFQNIKRQLETDRQ